MMTWKSDGKEYRVVERGGKPLFTKRVYTQKTKTEVVWKVLGQGRTLTSVGEDYNTNSGSIRILLVKECEKLNRAVFENGQRHNLTQHRPLPPTLNYLRRHKNDFLK